MQVTLIRCNICGIAKELDFQYLLADRGLYEKVDDLLYEQAQQQFTEEHRLGQSHQGPWTFDNPRLRMPAMTASADAKEAPTVTQDQAPIAIIYLYTEVAGDEAAGALRQQERVAREWAETNGYQVAHVLADVADRNQLREALAMVEEGRVRAIAIPGASTLAGGVGTAVMVALRRVGGVLLSAQEQMVSTGLFNR